MLHTVEKYFGMAGEMAIIFSPTTVPNPSFETEAIVVGDESGQTDKRRC